MSNSVDLPSPAERPSLALSHREYDGGVRVVEPAGEIDLATAPLLKQRLVEFLNDGCTRFVLDLSEVSYLDSTGLGVLIAFGRRLPADGLIVLTNAPASVQNLLTLTGLDASFPVLTTVEEGLVHARGDRNPGQPALSSGAAIVVGLAATALPFAESTVDELRRWIRILSVHGDAGRALRCVGLGDTDTDIDTDAEAEAPIELAGTVAATNTPQTQANPVARVCAAAGAVAADREAATVSTVDLLLAVMMVYGDVFDRELRAHGTSSIELIECLGSAPEPVAIS